METPQLLATAQGAETLGLSARTINAFRLCPKGPRYVGRRAIYGLADLVETCALSRVRTRPFVQSLRDLLRPCWPRSLLTVLAAIAVVAKMI